MEPSYIDGGNVKLCSFCGNSVAIPQKATYRLTILPSKSTPRYISKIVENRHLNRYLYTNVHSTIIHNSPKVETG